jgi:PIN domain nuclease of toxin-antitoxin system
LNPRFLLDTNIAVRWLTKPAKLSGEQSRVLREAVRRLEPLAISAVTLIEIAVVPRGRFSRDSIEIIREIESNPIFQIIPITFDVAVEVAAIGRHLEDPADRAIVSTARVRGLTLLTSGERIIDSNLVPVIA